ncbi:hypothetical protein [Rhizobium giardinii]|uniref:hypothetical protein n=1 Tax=Rhizobium giardinii TaxID=56731 RepID=UPI003D7011C0
MSLSSAEAADPPQIRLGRLHPAEDGHFFFRAGSFDTSAEERNIHGNINYPSRISGITRAGLDIFAIALLADLRVTAVKFATAYIGGIKPDYSDVCRNSIQRLVRRRRATWKLRQDLNQLEITILPAFQQRATA